LSEIIKSYKFFQFSTSEVYTRQCY